MCMQPSCHSAEALLERPDPTAQAALPIAPHRPYCHGVTLRTYPTYVTNRMRVVPPCLASH